MIYWIIAIKVNSKVEISNGCVSDFLHLEKFFLLVSGEFAATSSLLRIQFPTIFLPTD